jgi:ABC-2 type transport system permease protein
MINYLKSELYRLLRKKSVYFFLILCLIVPLIMTVMTLSANSENYTNTEFVFRFVQNASSILIFIAPIIINLIQMDDFSDGTFKNMISFGLSRKTIFIGKWLLSVLFLLVAGILAYLSLTIGVFALLPNSGSSSYNSFNASMLGLLPLVLAAVTVSHCICFLSGKTMMHALVYIFLMMLLPEFYYMYANMEPVLMAFVNKVPLFPYAALNDKLWQQQNGYLLCWALGLVYMFSAFLLSYRQVEIKEFK